MASGVGIVLDLFIILYSRGAYSGIQLGAGGVTACCKPPGTPACGWCSFYTQAHQRPYEADPELVMQPRVAAETRKRQGASSLRPGTPVCADRTSEAAEPRRSALTGTRPFPKCDTVNSNIQVCLRTPIRGFVTLKDGANARVPLRSHTLVRENAVARVAAETLDPGRDSGTVHHQA